MAEQPGGGQQDTHAEQRERIRATEQQRVQVENCTKSENQVRQRAREMAEAAKRGGVNNQDFIRLHEQLRQEMRTMQQERDRFMTSLSEEQGSVLQDRIRKMDQSRDRLNDQVRLLEAEMAKPNPDPKRISNYSHDLDKAMNEWQKRFRETTRDMGVES
jgi:hypothetical protein